MIDEAARTIEKREDFEMKLSPMLAIPDCFIFMISTPTNRNSYFYELIQRSKNGELPFDVVTIGVSCLIHRKAMEPQACLCKMHEVPSFHSPMARREVAAIFGKNSKAQLSELFSMHAESTANAFSREQIDNLFDVRLMPEKLQEKPAGIFVGVDPGGGGPSELAIGVVGDYGTHMRILALAALPNARGHKVDQVAMRWLEAVLDKEPYCWCVQVVAVEGMQSTLGGFLAESMKEKSNRVILSEMKSQGQYRIGVPKTWENTKTMVGYAQGRMLARGVFVDPDLVGLLETTTDQEERDVRIDPFTPEGRSAGQEAKKSLLREMRNFEKDDKDRYSGKMHGPDDMVVAGILMPIYWRWWFANSDKYEFHKKIYLEALDRFNVLIARQRHP